MMRKKSGAMIGRGVGAEWCYEVEIFHNIEVFPIANFPGGGGGLGGGEEKTTL